MHLTDAEQVAALPARRTRRAHEDARGDECPAPGPGTAAGGRADRTPRRVAADPADAAAAADRAGRGDAAHRRRGQHPRRRGAARRYQKGLGAPIGAGTDPAAWYAAVARYSGADTRTSRRPSPTRSYAVIATGASRRDRRRQAGLARPPRAVKPTRRRLDRLGLRKKPNGRDGWSARSDSTASGSPRRTSRTARRRRLRQPRPRRTARRAEDHEHRHPQHRGRPTTRPSSWSRTRRTWRGTTPCARADGHIAQHLKAKDVGWHAGNWYVNAKSIGLEHEGFAAPGRRGSPSRCTARRRSWCATCATEYDIPLDMQHIFGHDKVPGVTPGERRRHALGPGPLLELGALLPAARGAAAVAHRSAPQPGPRHASGPASRTTASRSPAARSGGRADQLPRSQRGQLRLPAHRPVARRRRWSTTSAATPTARRRRRASPTSGPAPRPARPSPSPSARATGRRSGSTASKGWFLNPASDPTAVPVKGSYVVPKAGLATAPVYGRAYPEASAYPAGIPVQAIAPLQYSFAAGQRYAVGDLTVPTDYYRAVTFDGSGPGNRTVIRGAEAVRADAARSPDDVRQPGRRARSCRRRWGPNPVVPDGARRRPPLRTWTGGLRRRIGVRWDAGGEAGHRHVADLGHLDRLAGPRRVHHQAVTR